MKKVSQPQNLNNQSGNVDNSNNNSNNRMLTLDKKDNFSGDKKDKEIEQISDDEKDCQLMDEENDGEGWETLELDLPPPPQSVSSSSSSSSSSPSSSPRNPSLLPPDHNNSQAQTSNATPIENNEEMVCENQQSTIGEVEREKEREVEPEKEKEREKEEQIKQQQEQKRLSERMVPPRRRLNASARSMLSVVRATLKRPRDIFPDPISPFVSTFASPLPSPVQQTPPSTKTLEENANGDFNHSRPNFQDRLSQINHNENENESKQDGWEEEERMRKRQRCLAMQRLTPSVFGSSSWNKPRNVSKRAQRFVAQAKADIGNDVDFEPLQPTQTLQQQNPQVET